jgi:hypothetical protein
MPGAFPFTGRISLLPLGQFKPLVTRPLIRRCGALRSTGIGDPGYNWSVRVRHLYLFLCVAGVLLPYWKLVPWLMDHGLDLSLLCQELFATRIGAFFGLDVVVSAIALFVFITVEGRRLALSFRWLPIVATLLVGVSLGLPLFLYLRQRQLDAAPLR